MRHEKPELSPKNPYHLSRHRYYELKHFCFQYKEWKKALALLDGWQSHGDEVGGIIKGNMPSDPTERYAILRAYYSQHIKLINDCLAMLEPAIAPYILKGVTEGIHDLKTGAVPAHMEQLFIYDALFCMEYHIHPKDIRIENRIYQNDDILIETPTFEEIDPIVAKIKEFDNVIAELKLGAVA